MASTKPFDPTAFDYQAIAKHYKTPERGFQLGGQQMAMVLVGLMVAAIFHPQHQPAPAPIAAQAIEQEAVMPIELKSEGGADNHAPAESAHYVSSPVEDSLAAAKPVWPDGQVLLEKDAYGQFYTQGQINGSSVVLQADTGASIVMIPEKTAHQIGLAKGNAILVNTAAGPVLQYRTRLQTLRIGSIVLHDVEATIAPGLAEEGVLLGMNVLAGLRMKMDSEGLTLSTSDSPR